MEEKQAEAGPGKQELTSQTLGRHLTSVVTAAVTSHGHLFAPEELRVLERLLEVPEPSRFLFARLMHRKTLWQQQADLEAMDATPEALDGLSEELVRSASTENDWAQIIQWSLSVAQLKQILAKKRLPNLAGLKRDDLIKKLLSLKRQKVLFASSTVDLGPSVAEVAGKCVRLAKLAVRACRLALLIYYPLHVWTEYDADDPCLEERGGSPIRPSECPALMTTYRALEYFPVEVILTKPLFATREELLRVQAAKDLYVALALLIGQVRVDNESEIGSGNISISSLSFQDIVPAAEAEKKSVVFMLPCAVSSSAVNMIAQLRAFVSGLDVACECTSNVDHRPILVEALYTGVSYLEKLKRYKDAILVLELLCEKAVFDASLRMHIWDRLSLDYVHASAAMENSRARAAQACRLALSDPLGDAWHPTAVSISRRLDKVSGALAGKEPDGLLLAGVRVRETLARHTSERKTGYKAKFVNPRDDEELESDLEINVEALALQMYSAEGWAGVHDEGRALRALFRVLCWDILFVPAPDAFFSEFQTLPRDIGLESFVESRREVIVNRLQELSCLSGPQLVEQVLVEETRLGRFEGFPWSVAGEPGAFGQPKKSIRSNRDANLREHTLVLAMALGGERTAKLCSRILARYRLHRAGAPDLMMARIHGAGDPSTSSVSRIQAMLSGQEAVVCPLEVVFVEVKSHNDRLAHRQTAWLNALVDCGIQCEVLRVKHLEPSTSSSSTEKKARLYSQGISSDEDPDDSDDVICLS